MIRGRSVSPEVEISCAFLHGSAVDVMSRENLLPHLT